MGRSKVSQYRLGEGDQQERVNAMLVQLELVNTVNGLTNLVRDSEVNHSTYYDFLERILEKEILQREEARVNRWIKAARFPVLKTIDKFDFAAQLNIDEQQVREIASCRFIHDAKNVVLFGPPGVGKTHLAIGFAREAILKGFEARFLTVDRLIELVRHQDEEGLRRLLRTLTNPPLLVIDDIDYEEPSKNVSNFLFKLIFRRHETQKSTIITSNKPFSEWELLFNGDRVKASAAIDRICDNSSYIMTIQGESYRVTQRHKLAPVMT